MTDLRFRVLGPLEASKGTQPVPVPRGRRRAVLACLLAHADRPVSADSLIEAAWRDDVPTQPRAALHTVLSRLRAALGTDAIVSDVAGYALAVPPDAVDAHRFTSLWTRARSAASGEAAVLLRQALALWRGPAYEEFSDRDFAAAEAQRLERLHLDATEELAAVLLDTGEHEEAVARLEELLCRHPFREHAVELLMTTLYRAGMQADALARYRAYRDLISGELGLEPSPALRELEARILGHDLPSGRGRRESMEAPIWLDTSSGFFGRDAALAHLVTAVATNRVVTVTGIGGVGKTRLVAEALPALSDRLQTPVTVVELAPVETGGVGTAVADALRLNHQVETVEQNLLEFLSASRTLLVLDNCEHLRAEVAKFAEAVTRRCPRVRLLATSRHRLGIGAERVVPLAPFPVVGRPGHPTDLDEDPAVRMFVDRLTRLRPSFRLSQEDVGTVAELCRRLDGLPLALELAASRAATLGVESVLRWSRGGSQQTALRTLRSVVDWSVQLLTADQRRLLRHLAVFADGFGAEDVSGVAARLGPWTRGGDVVSALEGLVESNLLAARGEGVELRYRMLALVRAFALEQLSDSGEEEQARAAHAQWVCDVVELAAQDWVSGHAASAGARLTRVGADVNAALQWTMEAGHLDIAARITGAVKLCMHWVPGVALGDLVLQVAERCAGRPPDPRLALGVAAGAMTAAERGDQQATGRFAGAALDASDTAHAQLLACMALAVSTFYSGEHEESAVWLQRVVDLPKLAPGYRVEAHITRALIACARADLPMARQSVTIALVGAEAARAEAAMAFALYTSGEINARIDPDRGAAEFREAAAAAERIGAAHVSQVSRLALLAVLVRGKRYDEALTVVVPLLRDVRRTGTWPQMWTALRIAAELLVARRRHEDAVFLLAAAEAAPTAPPLVGDDVGRYARLEERLRRHLGASAVDRIGDLAAGTPRALVVERAMALLADLGSDG